MTNSTANTPTSPDSHNPSPQSGGQISWITKRGPLKVTIRASGGEPNFRSLTLNGEEIHHCEIGAMQHGPFARPTAN
jgi:hypothetical protein